VIAHNWPPYVVIYLLVYFFQPVPKHRDQSINLDVLTKWLQFSGPPCTKTRTWGNVLVVDDSVCDTSNEARSAADVCCEHRVVVWNASEVLCRAPRRQTWSTLDPRPQDLRVINVKLEADIHNHISQGSAATRLRSGGIFNDYKFTAKSVGERILTISRLDSRTLRPITVLGLLVLSSNCNCVIVEL